MKYMGSKNRIAKHILPIMLKDSENVEYFYDLTVGGCGLLDKVPNRFKRVGVDVNKYVIQALETIRDCSDKIPKNNKEFTEMDYKNLRLSDEYMFKGYAGFAFSYSGKWLGGWCRDNSGKRDYVSEAYRNAIKQSKLIQDVEFICGSYDSIELCKNSIIYIDPPYLGTTKYKDSFDYDKFYKWCIEKHKEGYKIFISEYYMPSPFKCIWEKEVCSSLTKDTGSKKGIEKLWVVGDE